MNVPEYQKPVIIELEPAPYSSLSPELQALLSRARRRTEFGDFSLVERALNAWLYNPKLGGEPTIEHSGVLRTPDGVFVRVAGSEGTVALYKVRNDGRLRFINNVTAVPKDAA